MLITLRMRIKRAAYIRSLSQGVETEEMVADQAPNPSTYWMKFVMTDEKVQDLVNYGLLGPKVFLDWRATAGQEFPTKDRTEAVIFAAFFEWGFSIPTEDFFCVLLNYYKIELVHLNLTPSWTLLFLSVSAKPFLASLPISISGSICIN